MTALNKQALNAILTNALVANEGEAFMTISPEAMVQIEAFAKKAADTFGADANKLSEVEKVVIEAQVMAATPAGVNGELIDNVIQPIDDALFQAALAEVDGYPPIVGHGVAVITNLLLDFFKANPKLKLKAQ